MQFFTSVVCFIAVLIQCQVGHAMLKKLSMDHLMASNADILCIHSDNKQMPMEVFAEKYHYIHQNENLLVASKYPLNTPEENCNSLDLLIQDDGETLGHLYFSDTTEQTLCLEYNNADCSVEAIAFTMEDEQSSGLASIINRKKHLRLPNLAAYEFSVDAYKDKEGGHGARAGASYGEETKGGTRYEGRVSGEVSKDKEGKTSEKAEIGFTIKG